MEIAKGKVGWFDVVLQEGDGAANNDLLGWLRHQFHFHPIILKELEGPSARAHVEAYDSYLYLVYQFPLFDAREKVSKRSEIDVLITKKEVITVRYAPLEPLDQLKRQLAIDPHLKERVLDDTLQLLYHMVQSILNFNQRQLRHVGEKVENVSTKLFHNREREMLEELSYLKRDISEYRLIFRPQGQLLQSLVLNGEKFWGEKSRPYLNDLLGDHLKLVNQLEDYRMAVSDFEETNNQLMNIKTTEVMKRFTALSFLTFPFMLFAAIFSMETTGTPLAEHPNGFWIIVGVIVAGMAATLAYFKKKHWL